MDLEDYIIDSLSTRKAVPLKTIKSSVPEGYKEFTEQELEALVDAGTVVKVGKKYRLNN